MELRVWIDLVDVFVVLFGVAVVQVLIKVINSDVSVLHVLSDWQQLFLQEVFDALGSAAVVQLFLDIGVELVRDLANSFLDVFNDALGVNLLVNNLVLEVIKLAVLQVIPLGRRHLIALVVAIVCGWRFIYISQCNLCVFDVVGQNFFI